MDEFDKIKFEDKVIGIVGGMGPQAGVALVNNILKNAKATSDQQHLSTIMMSFPKYIEDRTLFIEGGGSINPAFNITKIISKLENAGAVVVGIACNTSYSPAIYDIIIDGLNKINSNVNLVHMPLETCKFLKDNFPYINRVGLMTTNGTFKSNVYKNILQKLNYDVVLPDFEFQNNVIHKMIYDPVFGIKSNSTKVKKQVKLLMDKSLRFFEDRQTQAIILGCTELSIVFTKKKYNGIMLVDSTECLAKALIREANS